MDTVKIRHCKTCPHKCDVEEPVVGCLSVMVPYRLELAGRVYTSVCTQRTWFNREYQPVRTWTARPLELVKND